MAGKKGFTLIELLVVVAIIALLLSILTPALNSVKERARRILCKNRLKQWGIAIFSYNAANNNLMFMIRRYYPPEGPFPQLMSSVKDYTEFAANANEQRGEWNAWGINPYIECIDKNFDDTGIASEIMTCPNCSGEYQQEWIWWHWNEGLTYFDIAYSYWVIGGIKPPINIGPECSDDVARDLTIDTLSSKRLLMSEIINIDEVEPGGYKGLRYNHGRKGWSWGQGWATGEGAPIPPPGHMKTDGEQDATGRSQLFGDGRVEWREISPKFDDNVPSEQTLDGYYEDDWNGPGSGWVENYNPSYY
jgi:prepilin-type N-terminal cleavage/methylation domain-containing protein